MGRLIDLLRQWLSQDVARTNALQASVRLQHRRRQLDDLDAFLAAQHHPRRHEATGEPSTATVHAPRPRQRPH